MWEPGDKWAGSIRGVGSGGGGLRDSQVDGKQSK